MDEPSRFALDVQEAAAHQRRAQELIREASLRMEYAAKQRGEAAARGFSISRAVQCMVESGAAGVGYEADLLRQRAEQRGLTYNHFEPSIPFAWLSARASVAGTGSMGGYLVADPVSAAAEALAPYMSAVRLGAQVIPVTAGDFHVPQITTGGQAAWLAEGAAGTSADLTLSEVSLTPMRVQASVQVSKQLLKQSAADQIISRDLLTAVGSAFDAAIFSGTGAGVPTGIRYTSGIDLGTGTSFAAATAASMLAAVDASNVNAENVAFVAHHGVKQTLSTRASNGTGSEYLWRGNELFGRRAAVNAGCGTGVLIAGDFSEVYLPTWGDGLQLSVDAMTHFRADVVVIKASLYANVAVTRPAAFSARVGVT